MKYLRYINIVLILALWNPLVSQSTDKLERNHFSMEASKWYFEQVVLDKKLITEDLTSYFKTICESQQVSLSMAMDTESSALSYNPYFDYEVCYDDTEEKIIAGVYNYLLLDKAEMKAIKKEPILKPQTPYQQQYVPGMVTLLR